MIDHLVNFEHLWQWLIRNWILFGLQFQPFLINEAQIAILSVNIQILALCYFRRKIIFFDQLITQRPVFHLVQYNYWLFWNIFSFNFPL